MTFIERCENLIGKYNAQELALVFDHQKNIIFFTCDVPLIVSANNKIRPNSVTFTSELLQLRAMDTRMKKRTFKS